jgi:two-component system response regulator DevR
MKDFVNKPIRVIIVDDHEMVRAGLRTLFSGFPQIRVMGEAATAAAAVECVSIVPADVLLLDIRLPDASGFEVCRKVQKSHPSLKVLFLTSYFNDQMVMDALSAGAEGYLLKEINAEVLVRSIEEIMEGKSVLDPAVTRRVMDSVRKGETLGNRAKLETLSPQEQKVIALVAEGLTNKEIAVQMNLSDKTVKNYLSNLMEKLQLKRRSHAAAFYAQATC